MTTRSRAYPDEYSTPPCSTVPQMRGDMPAPLTELRIFATEVCAKCDPVTFRDCKRGQTDDKKWTIRAGMTRIDYLQLVSLQKHNTVQPKEKQ